MTALPLRLKQRPAPAAQGCGRGLSAAWRPCSRSRSSLAGGAKADEPVKGEVKVFTDGGFARLVFRLDEEVEAKVDVSGAIMVISFKKPVAIAVDRLNASAPDYISAARRDPDGTAIRLALARKVKVNTIPAAERLFVDLLPETWTGLLPGLPQEVVDELARRAREAERQLHQQRLAAKQKKPARGPGQGRQPADLHPLRVRNAGHRQCRARAGRRQAHAQFRSADQMGSGGRQGDLAVDAGIDRRRHRFRFRRGHLHAQRHADGAHVPRGPQHRGRCRPRGRQAQAGGRAGGARRSSAGCRAHRGAGNRAGQGCAAPEQPPKPAAPVPPKRQIRAAAAAPAPNQRRAATPSGRNPAPCRRRRKRPNRARAADAAAVDSRRPCRRAARPSIAPRRCAEGAREIRRRRPRGRRPIRTRRSWSRLHRSGDNLRVEFPFAVPTPAAVFRRADTLWLVFDSAAKIDLAALTADVQRPIRSAAFERGADGEGIVRIRLERPRLVSVDADGPGWIVNHRRYRRRADAPARHRAQHRRQGPRQHRHSVRRCAQGASSRRSRRRRPADGDHRARAGARLPQGAGFRRTARAAVDPWRGGAADRRRRHGRARGRQGHDQPAGRAVAVGDGDRPAAARAQLPRLDLRHPALGLRPRGQVQRPAVRTDPDRRRRARQQAQAGAAQSRALLSRARHGGRGQGRARRRARRRARHRRRHRQRAQGRRQRDARPARGGAQGLVQSGDRQPAGRADLARDRLCPPGQMAGSARGLQECRRRHGRAAARTAAHGDAGGAALGRSRCAISPAPRAWSTNSRPSACRPSWSRRSRCWPAGWTKASAATRTRSPTTAPPRPRATAAPPRKAACARSCCCSRVGDMPRKDVIHELETLTTVWRGDETEIEGLKLLAHLYTEDGRYRDAFHVMRTALMAHPNSDLTRKIQDEAAATFDSLFLAGKGDALPPIEALGLFYDFRELTPIGRRGDEMIRRLADRLVSVDLLDQAAELLQHQVDHRLQGAARAQVATRLAMIYLMNRKPDRALATLQATRTAELVQRTARSAAAARGARAVRHRPPRPGARSDRQYRGPRGDPAALRYPVGGASAGARRPSRSNCSMASAGATSRRSATASAPTSCARRSAMRSARSRSAWRACARNMRPRWRTGRTGAPSTW